MSLIKIVFYMLYILYYKLQYLPKGPLYNTSMRSFLKSLYYMNTLYMQPRLNNVSELCEIRNWTTSNRFYVLLGIVSACMIKCKKSFRSNIFYCSSYIPSQITNPNKMAKGVEPQVLTGQLRFSPETQNDLQ